MLRHTNLNNLLEISGAFRRSAPTSVAILARGVSLLFVKTLRPKSATFDLSTLLLSVVVIGLKILEPMSRPKDQLPNLSIAFESDKIIYIEAYLQTKNEFLVTCTKQPVNMRGVKRESKVNLTKKRLVNFPVLAMQSFDYYINTIPVAVTNRSEASFCKRIVSVKLDFMRLNKSCWHVRADFVDATLLISAFGLLSPRRWHVLSFQPFFHFQFC